MATTILTHTDVRIRDAVLRQLEWDPQVDSGAVGVAAKDGAVTLTGKVNWLFHKREAEKAVRHIRGVRDVVNYIEVAPHAVERDVCRRIVQALHQSADVDARHITVTVADDKATLTGTVGTWMQLETAERAAANAPGVRDVVNMLVVVPPAGAVPDPLDEIC